MITVNEHKIAYQEGLSLYELRDRIKPEADICIYNGFPVKEDQELHDHDTIVFIKRGEIPEKAELQSLIYARHSPHIAEIFEKATIGIAGLGGLGSAVAIALARTGIGKLILVDFDIVEPSNLNRQHYFIAQLGQTKVTALTHTLQMINPYITLESHCTKLTEHNTNKIYQDAEILVEAFDQAEEKSMLVNTFLKAYPRRHIISASGIAGYSDSNHIRTEKKGQLYLIGDTLSAARPGQGLMAPRVGIAAHHQANTVIQILLKEFS